LFSHNYGPPDIRISKYVDQWLLLKLLQYINVPQRCAIII
jgi:hypothetical protein